MTLPASEFLAVWGILALNIAAPGPNVLNTIATAMGSGRGAGLMAAAGVALGVGAWCLGMALGLAAAFRAAPRIETAMTLLAAALLLWFAARYLAAARRGWRSPPAGRIEARQGIGPRAAFWRSLAVNATNPKALTTWLAILGIFPAARAAGADIALLCAGAAAIGAAIHALYALAFSAGPAARLYLRAAPAISAGVAVFFAAFALRLLAGL